MNDERKQNCFCRQLIVLGFVVSFLTKATLAAFVRTKINSVIKQQKERAFGFDREAGPLLQFS